MRPEPRQEVAAGPLAPVFLRAIPYSIWFVADCRLSPDGGPRYLMVQQRAGDGVIFAFFHGQN